MIIYVDNLCRLDTLHPCNWFSCYGAIEIVSVIIIIFFIIIIIIVL